MSHNIFVQRVMQSGKIIYGLFRAFFVFKIYFQGLADL